MTVLVGYANTPESRRAVEMAVEEAQRRSTSLHVLRYLVHEAGDSPTQARHDAQASRTADEQLEAIREWLSESGVPVTVELAHGLSGGAADALLRAADERDAELLVLGFRPRSAVEQIVMGSVARAVMRRARCPVLTVRADAE